MQKILYKPICHFTHEEATQILQQIKYNNADKKGQNSPVNKPQSLLLLNNNTTTNTNTYSRNVRMPSLQTISPHHQNQNNISKNPVQDSNKKSKVSIIGNYKQFSNEKDNLEKLKQQNSRLHFQKLALQASMNKLKQQNLRKDQEIARLKELINNKSSNVGMLENKNLNIGFVPQINRNQQVNFFSTFQAQRRPF